MFLVKIGIVNELWSAYNGFKLMNIEQKSEFTHQLNPDAGLSASEWQANGVQEFLERISDPEQCSLATLIMGLERIGSNINRIEGLSDVEKNTLEGLKGETTDFWRNPKISGVPVDQAINSVKVEIIKRLRAKVN